MSTDCACGYVAMACQRSHSTLLSLLGLAGPMPGISITAEIETCTKPRNVTERQLEIIFIEMNGSKCIVSFHGGMEL